MSGFARSFLAAPWPWQSDPVWHLHLLHRLSPLDPVPPMPGSCSLRAPKSPARSWVRWSDASGESNVLTRGVSHSYTSTHSLSHPGDALWLSTAQLIDGLCVVLVPRTA
eukprot:708422-Rhodomonas_salina.4